MRRSGQLEHPRRVIVLERGDAGQAEIDAFTQHLNAAIAHYTRVQQIAGGAEGPRPRPGLAN